MWIQKNLLRCDDDEEAAHDLITNDSTLCDVDQTVLDYMLNLSKTDNALVKVDDIVAMRLLIGSCLKLLEGWST